MKKLITGFQPFLDQPHNSTLDILKQIPSRKTEILPVAYSKILLQKITKHDPDILIMLGMNEDINQPQFETVANNYLITLKNHFKRFIIHIYCSLLAWQGKSIRTESLPKKNQTIKKRFAATPLSLPTPPTTFKHSTNAGHFVCNYLMHIVEQYARKHKPEMKRYFIHIPKDLNGKQKNKVLKFVNKQM